MKEKLNNLKNKIIPFFVDLKNKIQPVILKNKRLAIVVLSAVIIVILAILILITGLEKLILAIVVLFVGAFVGNYVQRNKEDVKSKLKKFIDKM